MLASDPVCSQTCWGAGGCRRERTGPGAGGALAGPALLTGQETQGAALPRAASALSGACVCSAHLLGGGKPRPLPAAPRVRAQPGPVGWVEDGGPLGPKSSPTSQSSAYLCSRRAMVSPGLPSDGAARSDCLESSEAHLGAQEVSAQGTCGHSQRRAHCAGSPGTPNTPLGVASLWRLMVGPGAIAAGPGPASSCDRHCRCVLATWKQWV